ncbi:copper resistance protein B [Microbulbifer sp. MLAF003]|uniref:copper resistance protein B n=1 Tax=Microbulbifer TaxID=48073 RepID=UPI0003775A82|nr:MULTISPECIES: copper resistance protein B [Microbulbifer]WHI51813.1 copper resistance protein B [Microbulbifer sp. MLAF003]
MNHHTIIKATTTALIALCSEPSFQAALAQNQEDLHHSIQSRSNETTVGEGNGIAGEEDKPTAKFSFDQFERRGQNGAAIEGDFSYGGDINKLVLEIDFERGGGETEKNERWLVYSRAISKNWNFLSGIRHDLQRESTSRNWLAVGLIGETPYSLEMDAVLFLGKSGSTAFRLEAEYEAKLAEKVTLIPRLELNFFGQNDEIAGSGTGLSQAELGLRLLYEIHPKFSPYVGVHHEREVGNAADFAREEGEKVYTTVWVIGIRAWF